VPVALGDPDALPKAAVAMATTIPSAFTVALGFLLAWRLSADRRASLLAAAALGFGTLVWPYSKFGFNAPLAAAALTGGVYGIGVGAHAEGRRLLAAGGAALGIAWLTRHELALAIVPAMVWLWWRVHRQPDRLARMSAALAGIAMAGAIWMTLNALHFGHPFWTGHQPDVTFRGIAAFLISPSGALLLYAPAALAGVILVSLAVQGAPLARLLAAVTLVLAAFYGSLDDWLGTRSYGPRYLVPVLPLLVAPLAVWWSRARRRRHRGSDPRGARRFRGGRHRRGTAAAASATRRVAVGTGLAQYAVRAGGRAGQCPLRGGRRAAARGRRIGPRRTAAVQPELLVALSVLSWRAAALGRRGGSHGAALPGSRAGS
jgi:4-amino-4-deoxy-L-arabinose transferase-like glycosyltransferase